jgi:polyisoprenoid-binding protein YceI
MFLLLPLFFFVFSIASAQVQNYKIIPEQSNLTFDVSAQMHKVHGVSNAFSGTISGDPKDITAAKITIRLDPSNFDTDNDKRDKVMREKSLEIEKFPFIEFESTSIEAENKELTINEPAEATILGKLKLHGVVKEISVPVRILWDERQVSADAGMDLNLDEFGIFRPKVLFFRLQKEVKVRFRIVAERALDSL